VGESGDIETIFDFYEHRQEMHDEQIIMAKAMHEAIDNEETEVHLKWRSVPAFTTETR
jgi:hypothetical protein